MSEMGSFSMLAKGAKHFRPSPIIGHPEDAGLFLSCANRRNNSFEPPEALATIPTLGLSDLPRANKLIPREVTSIADTRVLYHDLFTNGILYLDLGFDLHVLPPELLSYVPLFGRALLETGVDNDDFVRLSQRIGR
jgi:Zn-dependent M16 (insulinase) family peptidase